MYALFVSTYFPNSSVWPTHKTQSDCIIELSIMSLEFSGAHYRMNIFDLLDIGNIYCHVSR